MVRFSYHILKLELGNIVPQIIFGDFDNLKHSMKVFKLSHFRLKLALLTRGGIPSRLIYQVIQNVFAMIIYARIYKIFKIRLVGKIYVYF